MTLGDRHLLLLPEDIIVFKILVTLPVVDVIRCTSVCKQWYSIIKTPDFISAHLSLSSSSSSRSYQSSVLIHHHSFTQKRQILSCHFDPESPNNYRAIPFPFTLSHHVRILGHIHGLFCLYNDQRSEELFCLWNPSTRRYVHLPSPPTSSSFDFITRPNIDKRTRVVHGFGFDDKNRDYKVVLLVYLVHLGMGEGPFFDTSNCQLFSLKRGCWRTLGPTEETKHCFVVGDGVFVNGAVHWDVWKYRHDGRFFKFVLAFNIAHETFKTMELPQELLNSSYGCGILEMKGSLAYLRCDYARPIQESQHINRYSIWVMKENGAANSWVKMWTFELTGNLVGVYGFWGNGDEILMKKRWFGKGELFLYDTRTHGTRDFAFDVLAYIYGIYVYDESLILIDKESGAVLY